MAQLPHANRRTSCDTSGTSPCFAPATMRISEPCANQVRPLPRSQKIVHPGIAPRYLRPVHHRPRAPRAIHLGKSHRQACVHQSMPHRQQTGLRTIHEERPPPLTPRSRINSWCAWGPSLSSLHRCARLYSYRPSRNPSTDTCHACCHARLRFAAPRPKLSERPAIHHHMGELPFEC